MEKGWVPLRYIKKGPQGFFFEFGGYTSRWEAREVMVPNYSTPNGVYYYDVDLIDAGTTWAFGVKNYVSNAIYLEASFKANFAEQKYRTVNLNRWPYADDKAAVNYYTDVLTGYTYALVKAKVGFNLDWKP